MPSPLPSPDPRVEAIVDDMLADVRDGVPGADERVMAVLGPMFRATAVRYLGGDVQRADCSPTDLCHEAYARLIEKPGASWESRTHFYRAMLKTMRGVSVDIIRRREMIERKIPEVARSPDDPPTTRTAMVQALGAALDTLGTHDPRKAEIVSLRVFGGLPAEDIADMLGLGERTVRREWASAVVWLQDAVNRELSRA